MSECESLFGGEPTWALRFEKICYDVDKCRARSGQVTPRNLITQNKSKHSAGRDVCNIKSRKGLGSTNYLHFSYLHLTEVLIQSD